jgi:hypothetical protein
MGFSVGPVRPETFAWALREPSTDHAVVGRVGLRDRAISWDRSSA